MQEPVGGRRARQGTQGGGNTVARSADRFTIQKCVKEYVFPKQKFETDGNLDFSNNEMPICRCMAKAICPSESRTWTPARGSHSFE